jgi:hypothetical protein
VTRRIPARFNPHSLSATADDYDYNDTEATAEHPTSTALAEDTTSVDTTSDDDHDDTDKLIALGE